MPSTNSNPIPLQNQNAAEALLEPFRIYDGTLALPLAKYPSLENNRPLNKDNLETLRRSFKGRLNLNEAKCQFVFFSKESAIKTPKQAKARLGELCEQNKLAIADEKFDWLDSVFEVRISGGQHRAAILKELNWTGVLWPSEIFFSTILKDPAARFELLHGRNRHVAALSASLSAYCDELNRRIEEAVVQNADDPSFLVNLDPREDTFRGFVKVLEGWTPNSSSEETTAIKTELVKLFVTSRELAEIVTEMAPYGAWDAATSSFAVVSDWIKHAGGDIMAAAMRITTPPFEALFGGAPSLLTRLVANKMNKTSIPTNEEGLKTLGKHVKNQIGPNDWATIAEAGTEQLEDLQESAKEFGQFVGPSHVGKTLKVWTLCKKVFIPLACSIDLANAKLYKAGGGGKGKITKPLTHVIEEKLYELADGEVDRPDIHEAVKCFVDEVVAHREIILVQVANQKERAPLEPDSLVQGTKLAKALDTLLAYVDEDIMLEDLLPNSNVPEPRAPESESSDDEAPPAPPQAAKEKGKAPVRKPREAEPPASLEGSVQKELHNLVATLPDVNEDIKQRIHEKETSELANQVLSIGASDKIRQFLEEFGLTGPDDVVMGNVCDRIGDLIGDLLTDDKLLETLLLRGANKFLKEIKAYQERTGYARQDKRKPTSELGQPPAKRPRVQTDE